MAECGMLYYLTHINTRSPSIERCGGRVLVFMIMRHLQRCLPMLGQYQLFSTRTMMNRCEHTALGRVVCFADAGMIFPGGACSQSCHDCMFLCLLSVQMSSE
jgi:hypothetical protein